MIMEDQHMTQQVFADFLQQSPATLSSIFNGRTRPTLNIVEAIKAKIPDISTEWLLFGTGDMRISKAQSGESDSGSASGSSPSEMMLNFETPVKEMPHVVTPQIPVVQLPEKEPRKVTEIRVYYDDQTYETFIPAKK